LVFFMVAAVGRRAVPLAFGLYTAAAAALKVPVLLVGLLFSAVPVALVVLRLPVALVFNPVAVAAVVQLLIKMAAMAALVKPF
jgi:hypothetical protein